MFLASLTVITSYYFVKAISKKFFIQLRQCEAMTISPDADCVIQLQPVIIYMLAAFK